MSYKELVYRQDAQRERDLEDTWRTAILALWIATLVAASIWLAGCGRTLKTTGKAALAVTQAAALDLGEALYRTGQQMGQTDVQATFGSPAGHLPPTGAGSMATDNVPAPAGDYITRGDLESIASRYGVSLEGGQW
jgi:hypothetical protein